MYIIKQKDNLNTRFVQDCEDNWAYDIKKAKIWASKALADAYVKLRRYKKCLVEELDEANKNRVIKYKQTKCWNCKNATKCSWATGEPVPNWNAVPTKIKEATINGVPILVDSYLVLDCPEFKRIDFESDTEKCQRLAQEHGVSVTTIRNRLKELKEKLNDNK